jgi:hypothetical protein
MNLRHYSGAVDFDIGRSGGAVGIHHVAGGGRRLKIEAGGLQHFLGTRILTRVLGSLQCSNEKNEAQG